MASQSVPKSVPKSVPQSVRKSVLDASHNAPLHSLLFPVLPDCLLVFVAVPPLAPLRTTMNTEKLARLQSMQRIGGKGTPRRTMHKAQPVAPKEDKKLSAAVEETRNAKHAGSRGV